MLDSVLGTGDSDMNPCSPEINDLISTICNAKISSELRTEEIPINFGNGEQF